MAVLLGLAGFVLLGVSEVEGELKQALETTAGLVGCPGCGAVATLHDRCVRPDGRWLPGTPRIRRISMTCLGLPSPSACTPRIVRPQARPRAQVEDRVVTDAPRFMTKSLIINVFRRATSVVYRDRPLQNTDGRRYGWCVRDDAGRRAARCVDGAGREPTRYDLGIAHDRRLRSDSVAMAAGGRRWPRGCRPRGRPRSHERGVRGVLRS